MPKDTFSTDTTVRTGGHTHVADVDGFTGEAAGPPSPRYRPPRYRPPGQLTYTLHIHVKQAERARGGGPRSDQPLQEGA